MKGNREKLRQMLIGCSEVDVSMDGKIYTLPLRCALQAAKELGITYNELIDTEW